MSIGVQSYVELYTMLLGWDLYGKCWDLLTQTGIAYLPFIGIILKNVSQSYVLHGHEGSAAGLRMMEMHLLVTLLCIFFGAAPLLSINSQTVSYSPVCAADSKSKNKNDNKKTVYPGATDTTFDKAFTLPNGTVRAPIWWYAVIAVSEGMTNAAKQFLTCVPDLRKMVTQVNMTQITDPAVKAELLDFQTMCYAPAKVQFLKDVENNNTANLSKIKEKKFSSDDTEWVGSHAFSELYYPHLKSSRAVPGFAYVKTEDINATDNSPVPPTTPGTPNCDKWWNDETYGLRKRIYVALPESFQSEFGSYLQTEKAKDGIVKGMLMRTPSYANGNNTVGDSGYSHVAAAVGTLYAQAYEYPKLYAAAQAAPIIQAVLLMLVYVFLPFGLVFSGYQAKTFVAGAIFIFSLIFWGFIWQLVNWLDSSLMQALYSGWFEKQQAGATLTDMIIASLIVIAPLFWFIFMGALGIAAGHAVSHASAAMNRIGENAAQGGANAVQQAGKAVVTKGVG